MFLSLNRAGSNFCYFPLDMDGAVVCKKCNKLGGNTLLCSLEFFSFVARMLLSMYAYIHAYPTNVIYDVLNGFIQCFCCDFDTAVHTTLP